MASPRFMNRNIKSRALKDLSDDTLIRWLIESSQDANDPKLSRYPNEDRDLQLLIAEMLCRMDSANTILYYGDDLKRSVVQALLENPNISVSTAVAEEIAIDVSCYVIQRN